MNYIHTMIDPNITIVTAYYQIKSKFPVSKYEGWIQNFMKIRSNKIIFTNAQSIDSVKKYDDGKCQNKYIIMEIRDFLTSQYDTHWQKHAEMDHEQTHTVQLYKIWAEKTNFLLKASSIDPFNTHNFVWCDIGCFRNPSRIHEFLEWPKSTKVKDKIIFLEIQKFLEREKTNIKSIDNRFKHVNRIGGGIFAGNKVSIPKWHKVYYDLLGEFFRKNIFAGKDQNIYSFAILQNPALIHLVHVPHGYAYDKWFYLEDYLN
jgi:hypothetical protein